MFNESVLHHHRLHGSYQALEGGYAHDALVDFTGGIGEFFDLRSENVDVESIFPKMRRTFNNMNSLICAAIEVLLYSFVHV